MATISFACSSCKKVLKVPADKAGRKTKCSKCGKVLRVPELEEPEEETIAAEAPPKPVNKNDDKPVNEDDDTGGYGLVEGFDAPEQKEDKKKEQDYGEIKSKKEKYVKRKIKKKSVQYAEQWYKIHVTLVLMFAGICGWGLIWLLHSLVFLFGRFDTTQYAALFEQATKRAVDKEEWVNLPKDLREPRDLPPNVNLDQVADVKFFKKRETDIASLVMGLVSGSEYLGLGKVFFLIEYFVALLAGGTFLAGYFTCIGAPNLYGTRGQTIALISLGSVNILLGLMFRLLPALGVIHYTMVPLLAPEVCLNEANIDRMLPLQAFWCGAPFLETFCAILIQGTLYLEPVFFCIFLRAVALSVKDEEWLGPQTFTLLQLGFGQLFILLAFYLLSLTGSSEVLRLVLLAVYYLWRGFFLWFIIYFAIVMLRARTRLMFLLEPDEEELARRKEREQEEEEEDEEEEDCRRRKRRSRYRDEDEDD